VVRVFVGLSLLLTACQAQTALPDNAADGSTVAAASDNLSLAMATKPKAKKSTAVDDHCADERNPAFDPDKCVETEVRVDGYIGTWTVTNVAVADSGVQAFAKDDPSIVGSEFSIKREEIRWTKKTSDRFTSDDVCGLPSAGAMAPIVEKEEGTALIAAARRFAVDAKARGTLHRFGCVNSGRWGPGETGGNALFYPVAGNRMLLQWYDGTVLMAKKLN
jgi:hypothetical protein